ncbi:hypothetical protein LRB25_02260, partial [Borreliella burgdorferi]|nr:hypothetical protein [Borreliella burgdorferi]
KFYYFISIATKIFSFHSIIKVRVNIFYRLIHRIQAKSDKYDQINIILKPMKIIFPVFLKKK